MYDSINAPKNLLWLHNADENLSERVDDKFGHIDAYE